MGYESRVLVVNVHRYPSLDFCYAQIVADVRLSKMGSEFHSLFDKEIDFDIFIDDDEEARVDKYGDTLKEAGLDEILAWLKAEINNSNPHRRIPLLYGTLSSLDPNRWEELHIIHYGY